MCNPDRALAHQNNSSQPSKAASSTHNGSAPSAKDPVLSKTPSRNGRCDAFTPWIHGTETGERNGSGRQQSLKSISENYSASEKNVQTVQPDPSKNAVDVPAVVPIPTVETHCMVTTASEKKQDVVAAKPLRLPIKFGDTNSDSHEKSELNLRTSSGILRQSSSGRVLEHSLNRHGHDDARDRQKNKNTRKHAYRGTDGDHQGPPAKMRQPSPAWPGTKVLPVPFPLVEDDEKVQRRKDVEQMRRRLEERKRWMDLDGNQELGLVESAAGAIDHCRDYVMANNVPDVDEFRNDHQLNRFAAGDDIARYVWVRNQNDDSPPNLKVYVDPLKLHS
jgi:hypothetical protein